MSVIPVQLPVELEQFIEAKVASGHFCSASDYIVALVDAACKKRSSLDDALLVGLESGPATEWTSQEWQDLRKRLIDRQRTG